MKSMFYHAYNSYLKYAYPLDELKPLSCSGQVNYMKFLSHILIKVLELPESIFFHFASDRNSEDLIPCF